MTYLTGKQEQQAIRRAIKRKYLFIRGSFGYKEGRKLPHTRASVANLQFNLAGWRRGGIREAKLKAAGTHKNIVPHSAYRLFLGKLREARLDLKSRGVTFSNQ